MRRLLLLVLPLTAVWLAACDEVWLGEEVENTRLQNFDLFWTEIDRRYALFPVKDVDWKAAYRTYRPQAEAAVNDEELFDVMCWMLELLKDGHANLLAPFDTCGYTGWFDVYPRNFSFDVVRRTYLRGVVAAAGEGRMAYGRIGVDVGYVHINSFLGAGWPDDLDRVLTELGPVRALVVDVRDNGGGSSTSAEAIAGRFADRERLYAYYQYRDGAAYTDFAAPRGMYVRPTGRQAFTGPVAVLTNRRCFSACEDFVLAMRELPQVTVVGDTTGGGLGNPLFRELPNGWSYRFPVWLQTTPTGETLEGRGVPPDLAVHITPRDLQRGRDTIVQRALDLLAPAPGTPTSIREASP